MGYNNSTQASYQDGLQTIEGLREYINAGRSKTYRTLANNTVARLINGGQDVAIKLHNTDVVVFHGDGSITLNSGGWRSATTKERINRYTKAGMSQRNGVWYMNDGSLFYDDMVIMLDGTVKKPRKTDKYEKQLRAIKKKAKTYAKEYVQALEAGEVEYPTNGDCWACLMRGPKGQEMFPGSNHLQEHMKDKYFVPSLLVNAGRESGYSDMHISMMGLGGRKPLINPERIIYRYIVKKLQRELV